MKRRRKRISKSLMLQTNVSLNEKKDQYGGNQSVRNMEMDVEEEEKNGLVTIHLTKKKDIKILDI
jgi:hypothetical protein